MAKLTTWLAAIGAFILIIPALMYPPAWVAAAVLAFIWIFLSKFTPWAVREYLDYRKYSDMGKSATGELRDMSAGMKEDAKDWKRRR